MPFLCWLNFVSCCVRARTTDTQWRHKSKISENLGRCGRQNMLPPYLKIWDWHWIFGRAVKDISSLDVRSPCVRASNQKMEEQSVSSHFAWRYSLSAQYKRTLVYLFIPMFTMQRILNKILTKFFLYAVCFGHLLQHNLPVGILIR